MENGLSGENGFKGFGGEAVFFTGPAGGLMTQLGLAIVDRSGQTQAHNGREKSRAQGENLALLAAGALRDTNTGNRLKMKRQQVAVSAKTKTSRT